MSPSFKDRHLSRTFHTSSEREGMNQITKVNLHCYKHVSAVAVFFFAAHGVVRALHSLGIRGRPEMMSSIRVNFDIIRANSNSSFLGQMNSCGYSHELNCIALSNLIVLMKQKIFLQIRRPLPEGERALLHPRLQSPGERGG